MSFKVKRMFKIEFKTVQVFAINCIFGFTNAVVTTQHSYLLQSSGLSHFT